MGKTRNWFPFVQRLFISETKSTKSESERKSKRWRWMSGNFKSRKQHPDEVAAMRRTLSKATADHRKQVLAAATATAAAADAALAAANSAAEVAWLTLAPATPRKRNQDSAAIRIQTIYRGHLARKALKAIKGVVKLQAVIRGDIARRRMINKLKFIEGLVIKRSPVYQLRLGTADENHVVSERWEMVRVQGLELDGNNRRNWDISLVPKEQLDTLWLRKQDTTTIKSQCAKKSSHQERRNDPNLQVAVANDKSPTGPRRLITGDTKQKAIIGDYRSLPNSPVFPKYMATTQSAKAKTKSYSTPTTPNKQRLTFSDSHPDEPARHYPYKLWLSSSCAKSKTVSSIISLDKSHKPQ